MIGQTAADIRERIVAIVQFGPPTGSNGLNAGQYYQVTIDPRRFSPDGEYIRFGSYDGDEIMGWQKAECIYVISHLADWPYPQNDRLLQWGTSPILLE